MPPESNLEKTKRRLQEVEQETNNHPPCVICRGPVARRSDERGNHYSQRKTCSKMCHRENIRRVAGRANATKRRHVAEQGPLTRSAPTVKRPSLIDAFLRRPVLV